MLREGHYYYLVSALIRTPITSFAGAQSGEIGTKYGIIGDCGCRGNSKLISLLDGSVVMVVIVVIKVMTVVVVRACNLSTKTKKFLSTKIFVDNAFVDNCRQKFNFFKT